MRMSELFLILLDVTHRELCKQWLFLLSLGKFGNPIRLTTSAVLRMKDLVQNPDTGSLVLFAFKKTG